MKKKVYGVCLAISKQNEKKILLCDDNQEVTEVLVNECYCDIEVGKHYCVSGEVVEEQGKAILKTDYFEEWGRYCDHCGKHHTEGWYIGEHLYACCDECAIALCDGNEEDFRAGIIVDEDGELTDEAYTYWTEWE